jgi:4-amino-4-deoxy-L-arabinose transferase-like glycosyltransferase
MAAENSHPKGTYLGFTIPRPFTRAWPGILAALLFLLLSLIFIPYAGIQNDEALFASPLYGPTPGEFRIRIGSLQIPLMLMSYLGTLKTLIFWPLLSLFGTNVWSVRVPVALLGAGTVLLFQLIADRAIGSAAAAVGAVLLATSPVFLLTIVFDWGPVALQHFLLLAALLCLINFELARDRERWLAVGFMLLGLALWNKAIILWSFAGLAVAAMIMLRDRIRPLLTRRNLAIAAGSFVAGALPFIIYNVKSRSHTVTQNARIDWTGPAQKFVHLRKAALGDSLFGFVVEEEWAEKPKPPATALGRSAAWLRNHIGERRSTLFEYALLAAILAIPWWRRNRAAWFSLIFIAVTWLAMSLTRDAGGAAHHAILVWPFPVLFFAAALQSLPLRTIFLFVGGGFLVLMNLLVLNQHLVQFERNGAAGNFTDALLPLSSSLHGNVYTTDWGMTDTLVLLRRRELKVRDLTEALVPDSPNEMQRKRIAEALADPESYLVDHVAERHEYPNAAKTLQGIAEHLGYHKELVSTIADSNGRPVFEVFRYLPPVQGTQ